MRQSEEEDEKLVDDGVRLRMKDDANKWGAEEEDEKLDRTFLGGSKNT